MRLPPHKTWTLRSPEQADLPLDDWARQLDISERMATILAGRGLESPEAMDRFLSPLLAHLPQPREIPGMEEAARLLADAVDQGKCIAVWGDYDCDGVTSCALLLDYLRGRGLDPLHHLPCRDNEGYGLNKEGVERLAAQGAALLVTVDCGIADHEAVARARELGMTVVVTDHHLPPKEPSPAHAVTNPRFEGCPCPDIAGVGVAFFLVCAVDRMLPGANTDVRPFLDLVALGTLADVVPLKGVNRILVAKGLDILEKTPRPGLMALKEVAGYGAYARVESTQVAFGLAPRINAAGRMHDPELALDMLLAKDPVGARPTAHKLDEANSERRAEEDRILEQAAEQAEEEVGRLGIVVAADDWHGGVVGIVASRIKDLFYRPALVLCRDNGNTADGNAADGSIVGGDAPLLLKGSGRSIQEVDLHQALADCADVLEGFGGHKLAAGLRVSPDNLDLLRDRFHEAVKAQAGEDLHSPTLTADGELSFAELNVPFLNELALFQPTGPGNPAPVFLSGPLRVQNHRVVQAKHVFLDVRDTEAGVTLRAKLWNAAPSMRADLRGRAIRLAFNPRIDRYNGVASIDLHAKDWKELPDTATD